MGRPEKIFSQFSFLKMDLFLKKKIVHFFLMTIMKVN